MSFFSTHGTAFAKLKGTKLLCSCAEMLFKALNTQMEGEPSAWTQVPSTAVMINEPGC